MRAVNNVIDQAALSDLELETVLDQNDGRQLLHVTFGSVLTAQASESESLFRDAIRSCLIENEDEHYAVLKQHLGRHVEGIRR